MFGHGLYQTSYVFYCCRPRMFKSGKILGYEDSVACEKVDGNLRTVKEEFAFKRGFHYGWNRGQKVFKTTFSEDVKRELKDLWRAVDEKRSPYPNHKEALKCILWCGEGCHHRREAEVDFFSGLEPDPTRHVAIDVDAVVVNGPGKPKGTKI